MKKIYTQTFPEERIKVDDTIDNYFESLIERSQPKKELLPEEIIEALKTNNPDGWYDNLTKFMQHEMQHKN